MSKIKLLTIAVIGLLVLNTALVAFLMLRKPFPRPGKGGGAERGQESPKGVVINRLHFSEAQAKQYGKLIKEHQITIRVLSDSVGYYKKELYRSLISENNDEKDASVDRLGNLQKQIELAHYNHFLAIKKLCEPDQIADFNKLSRDLSKYFFQRKKPEMQGPNDR